MPVIVGMVPGILESVGLCFVCTQANLMSGKKKKTSATPASNTLQNG